MSTIISTANIKSCAKTVWGDILDDDTLAEFQDALVFALTGPDPVEEVLLPYVIGATMMSVFALEMDFPDGFSPSKLIPPEDMLLERAPLFLARLQGSVG